MLVGPDWYDLLANMKGEGRCPSPGVTLFQDYSEKGGHGFQGFWVFVVFVCLFVWKQKMLGRKG